jgi:biotin operon repressor
VWSQPIEILADELGVSDVAIHTACRKLKVEKPPRGHWLKQEQRNRAPHSVQITLF